MARCSENQPCCSVSQRCPWLLLHWTEFRNTCTADHPITQLTLIRLCMACTPRACKFSWCGLPRERLTRQVVSPQHCPSFHCVG
jgi:hypothetical protein